MITDPGYQAALDYLYSFINYEAKMPPSPQHARFNLQRLHYLLGQLENPHRQWPSVVVAGTKGKGSTAVMIESMLRAGGYRTGLYSSPHLHSWRERVQIDRQLIGQSEVVRLVGRLRGVVEAMPAELGEPTTFELATALAFVYFAEQAVDIAVLEVGLGGRYDTVNIVTPLVSILTPISYDHMAVLGNSLPEIAANKAGIIKASVPVVSAVQAPEADDVIRAEAAARQAPLYLAHGDGLHGPRRVEAYAFAPTAERLGLRGAYQVENAGVALGALMLLKTQGFNVPLDAQRQGLQTAHWPGRFEVLGERPVIVVDGAMNGASAERLWESLQTLPHKRMILVLGTSADKDVSAIARILVPGATAVIVTRSRHPRSAMQADIAAAVQPWLAGPIYHTADIPEALELARELATPDDLICVAGSLFVVAAAREALHVAGEID